MEQIIIEQTGGLLYTNDKDLISRAGCKASENVMNLIRTMEEE